MTTSIEIIIHADRPFICEAEVAEQMGVSTTVVRAMARDGRLPEPLIRHRSGNGRGYVFRTIDLHTHTAPVTSIRVAVANDTTPALDPATGKVSGSHAIEAAKQRRAAKPHPAANG